MNNKQQTKTNIVKGIVFQPMKPPKLEPIKLEHLGDVTGGPHVMNDK